MEEYSGWAFKLGEKGFVKNLTWKKRWCELKGPRLRYYKEKGAPQFQGFVDLTTATGLVKDSSKKSPGNFSFEIITPERAWVFSVETDAERAKWLACLDKSISRASENKTVSFGQRSAPSPPPDSSSIVSAVPVPLPGGRQVPLPPPRAGVPVPPPRTGGAAPPPAPRRDKSTGDLRTNVESVDAAHAQEATGAPSTATDPVSPPTVRQSTAPASYVGQTNNFQRAMPPTPMLPNQPTQVPNPAANQLPLAEESVPQPQPRPADWQPQNFSTQPQPMLSRARSGAIDPGSELRRSVPSPNATVQPVSLTSSGGASIASGGQASKRTNTAREVLQTERYYMECLQVMLEHYMQPLNAACQDRKQNPGFNENDIRSIFSNHLTLIVGVNNELLRGLESKLATWDDSNSKIADVFLMMAPFLKMYYEYSANYNAAIDTYNRLMKDPLFGARLLQYRQNSGKTLGLEHLLIMPVQRLPRYALLLGELLKDTAPDHPDFDDLKKAIRSLEDVTVHINESMKRGEAIKKIAADYDAFVQPHRLLLWDGMLETRINKTKTEIKFILFNDMLVHIPKAHARNKSVWMQPDFICPLQLVWVVPSVAHANDNCTDVILPLKTYAICQNTPDEKDFLAKLLGAVQKCLGTDSPLAERAARHVFSEDVTYEGSWNYGKMHGNGVLTYNHIGIYEGKFHLAEKNGHGKMTWFDGQFYEGEWRNGSPHGRGVYIYRSGDAYTGEFRDGAKGGFGDLRYVNGDHYSGEFEGDKPHGNGKLVMANGAQYEGGWCFGFFHGDGAYVDVAGRIYAGGWLNGLMEGAGEMNYMNGTSYAGMWRQGKRNGKGCLKTTINKVRQTYNGDFVNDLRDGIGLITFFDGSSYDGQWKEDKRHGVGRLHYRRDDPCGRFSYEGDWASDKFAGRGTLTYQNGDKYEGQFKDNLFHGNGVFTSQDGRKLEGKWANGVLEAKAIYTIPDLTSTTKTKEVLTGAFVGNVLTPPPKSQDGIAFSVPLPAMIPDISTPQL